MNWYACQGGRRRDILYYDVNCDALAAYQQEPDTETKFLGTCRRANLTLKERKHQTSAALSSEVERKRRLHQANA